MAFTRIITKKNGRQYLYAEERYREGGRVRSRSRCLGPVNGATRQPGWLRMQFPRTYGIDWDKIERDMLVRAAQQKAKADAFAARMYADYRMILTTSPVPTEKPPSRFGVSSIELPRSLDVPAPVAPDAPHGGQGQPSDPSSGDVSVDVAINK